MQSTMQDERLGVARIMRHARRVNGRAQVVTQTPEGRTRVSFDDIVGRAGKFADALWKRGIRPGDAIGSFASATQEHLEAYIAVPAMGAVLHTLNIRLHDEQLAEMVVEVADRVMLIDGALASRFASLAPLLERSPVELVVVTGRAAPPRFTGLDIETISYEALLDEGEPVTDWPDPPETDAAILCYTGGTTGKPKGIAYSHRSLWLQAMSLCTANSLSISAEEVILPAVPLYHVNGWGLPFAALMAGAGLVLPGTVLRPEIINALLEEEGVTLGAGVPTIWSDVLEMRQARGMAVPATLRRLSMGGAPVPERLINAWGELGVGTAIAWGMTETSSMSVVGRAGSEQKATGRIICGLELRLASLEGEEIVSDGRSPGEIQIRGPWVTAHYFKRAPDDSFQDGWLRTGDIGTLDGDGKVTLTDRIKDAIKSGGEWIPSLPLEEAIRLHPSISDVAVIALPDPRWQERPLAIVTPAGDGFDPAELAQFLESRIAKWWIPTAWARIDAIPRTTVGKPDKARMRAMLADGALNIEVAGPGPRVPS